MADVKDPIRIALENLVDIRRIENRFNDDVRRKILDLFDEIAALIAKHDPSGVQSRYRQGRIEKLMDEVERLTGEAFDDIFKMTRQNLAELGRQQSAMSARQLEAVLTGVDVDIETARLGINLFKAILDTDPLRGHRLEDWFQGQADSTIFRVRREIQLGVANEETIDDIVRRVRGTHVGFRRRDPDTGQFVRRKEGAILERVFSGGAMNTTTREAEAIVRTGVGTIVNEAHFRTYDENADIVIGYEWTATLDSRTCLQCSALDGQVFPLDEGPRPPDDTHISCRCTTTPLIDWEGIGVSEPPEGTRASVTYRVEDGELVRTGGKQVPASETYETWFRDQPTAVQDEIIGPGRARLFRTGKVDFRDMIRKDGRYVTLEVLERKVS